VYQVGKEIKRTNWHSSTLCVETWKCKHAVI